MFTQEEKTRFLRIPKNVIVEKMSKSPLLSALTLCSVGYRRGDSRHHDNIHKVGLDEYLINYCIEGEGWVEFQGRQYSIQAGDVFLCPAMVDHSYGYKKESPWTVYWSYFKGDHCDELYRMMSDKNNPYIMHIGYQISLINDFEELLHTMDKGYYVDKYMIHASSCLRQALSRLLLFDMNTSIQTDKNVHHDRINESIRFMQRQIDNFIDLDQLANEIHLSKDYYGKVFKREIGYSPLDYFLRLKMQKACELLDLTDMSIKEIALSLGYRDYYYFSRCFKKKIGMSPEKYRVS